MAAPNQGDVAVAGGAAGDNAAANNSYHSASLYVGDLHPDVTEANLYEIFNAVGSVASIRVCRDMITRRSLGYAYVNFHSLQDAERALDTMNYTPIKDRPCRIMWSQRDPSLRKTGQGNVFVKNLDLSIDNKALYDTFSLFGNILSCKVVTDKEGNSQGHGFVHFETMESAEEAIKKVNGMVIGSGKPVFVGTFQKRTERPESTAFTNIYVKNVPKHWSDERFSDLFNQYGEVSSCVVMRETDGKSKGFGFVDFVDHESAAQAVEALNKKEYPADEESEKIPEGESNSEDPEKPQRRVMALYVGRAQKKSFRERELGEKFEQLKVERQNKYQGVNIYVKNLDERVTDEMLHKEFEPFGSITSVRVMRDAPTSEEIAAEGADKAAGASKGFGFVCFSNNEEASRAVTDMQGRMILGKPIFVALAQRKDARRAQLEALHRNRMARGMPQPYAGFPVPYPMQQVPGMMPGQMPPRGYGFAPQLMMPRGAPRGVPPGQFPMMPAGGQMGQPFAPGQPMPRGAPNGQRGGRGGARGGARGPKGPMPVDGVKYNANVRNQPGMMARGMPPMPPAGPEPLTAAALANASEEEQKNMIGERLYPLIERDQPQFAGKITGMLLEMDNPELLHLLESPEALHAKVKEAVTVLEQHMQNSQ